MSELIKYYLAKDFVPMIPGFMRLTETHKTTPGAVAVIILQRIILVTYLDATIVLTRHAPAQLPLYAEYLITRSSYDAYIVISALDNFGRYALQTVRLGHTK